MLNFLKKNFLFIISILVAILIIGGALYFSGRESSDKRTDFFIDERQEYADNVKIVEGKQIIEIKAKGGFSPVHSIAKAGLPSILRINTNGTFDCSSVVRIPKLEISKNLPLTGITDIDIGTQSVGEIYGTCGMGMYPFDIDFK